MIVALTPHQLEQVGCILLVLGIGRVVQVDAGGVLFGLFTSQYHHCLHSLVIYFYTKH